MEEASESPKRRFAPVQTSSVQKQPDVHAEAALGGWSIGQDHDLTKFHTLQNHENLHGSRFPFILCTQKK
jgi:hypothetical protein